MYPPGTYRARIQNYGVFKSDTARNPQAFVKFELLGRYAQDGQLVACPPGDRTYYKAITEKTVAWLMSDLKSIGYDKDSLTYLDPEVPGAADLFGREIDVDCDHEDYQGDPRERWSIHRTRKKVHADELAKLDEQYASQLTKVPSNGKPAAPAAGNAQPQPPSKE